VRIADELRQCRGRLVTNGFLRPPPNVKAGLFTVTTLRRVSSKSKLPGDPADFEKTFDQKFWSYTKSKAATQSITQVWSMTSNFEPSYIHAAGQRGGQRHCRQAVQLHPNLQRYHIDRWLRSARRSRFEWLSFDVALDRLQDSFSLYKTSLGAVSRKKSFATSSSCSSSSRRPTLRTLMVA
jgi:hypothetical protein